MGGVNTVFPMFECINRVNSRFASIAGIRCCAVRENIRCMLPVIEVGGACVVN